jgi:hypothetical protein
VATYVIETYLSRARAAELEPATVRLREAVVAAQTAQGRFRHVRSYFIPEDELCFHVLEAPSLEATIDIVRRAGLSAERIVEAEPAPNSRDGSTAA